MKFRVGLSKRTQNSRGVVVILVLWVLMILTALAISLGKNAHIEMSLTKNALGKLKSKYLARAGIMYGLNQIAADSEDTASNQEDTLYYCGIRKNDSVDVEELFKDKKLGDGVFTIFYKQKDNPGDKEEIYYGLSDEERRINLNALSLLNVNVFIELLKLLNIEEDTAKMIAYSIIDWVDQDGNIEQHGAENDYYEGLSNEYRCKNLPIESMEELLLIRGMTPEILSKIRPYITLFPMEENAFLKINFNTASVTVLKALAYSSLEFSEFSPMDADGLVDKIVSYRSGKDGKAFTSDDEVIPDSSKQDFNSILNLNGNEPAVYSNINQYRTTNISNYFRIHSEGKDANGTKTNIEAVVSRKNYGIVSWRRN